MFDSTMHYWLSRAIWRRFCTHTFPAAFDRMLNNAAMLTLSEIRMCVDLSGITIPNAC